MRQNEFEISNATFETKPDAIVATKPSKIPIVFGAAQE